MYAINLLNFFLLFNGLRKIKIRLDALQRNRNYLHVLHCAKIKEELMTVCGPLPPMRYHSGGNIYECYSCLKTVTAISSRVFEMIINILPNGDTIADGCFVQK